MKILLTNDDGVNAPGILALYQSLKTLGQVTIVAPLEERSTTGHSLSLSHPLRLIEVDENRFGISGYPADCVLMGLGTVCESRPDLVISGINRGGNLGQDIFYSGTVAAAREGAFHRVPAIAVSLVSEFSKVPPSPEDYKGPAEIIKDLLKRDIVRHIPPLHLLNINIPMAERRLIKGIRVTGVGFRRYSDRVQKLIDPRSKEYYWVVGKYEGFEPIPDSDCQAIDDGYVSLSSISPSSQVIPVSQEFHKIIGEINQSYSLN